MNKVICDVCSGREASREFKFKKRLKGHYEKTGYGIRWNPLSWTSWENIAICGECAEKFLNLPYRGVDGFGRRPPEMIPKR